MSIPDELRYSADHEWVLISGGTARIGITDYAQNSLGDVVYVQIPSVGQQVAKGDSFSEVESTKSVSDIYAPLSGTISQVNGALSDTPEVVNGDPYGDGWLCEIELSDPSEVDALLDASAYRALVEG